MFNQKLATALQGEDLTKMGFTLLQDEDKDPRGNYYVIKNNKFSIYIDAWFEVQLRRVNPDTDHLTLLVETKFDLQCVLDWIADEDDEKIYTCVGCQKSISRNETSKVNFCHCVKCEKTLARISELEETRQKLLLQYQNGAEEDLDSLASEIVNYKIIIKELENTMKP